jgi:hypothetical protein
MNIVQNKDFPLCSWSRDLATDAQIWANKLAAAGMFGFLLSLRKIFFLT